MFFSLIYNLVKVILIIAMPFFILIRTAVYLHFQQGVNTKVAILASAISTTVLLMIYFSVIYGKFTKKKTKIKYLRRRFAITFFLVGVFVLHGIMFVSPDNTKSTAVGKEFNSLQPILRLGCSTLFLLDRDAIITDASRTPEDYRKMGLKTLKNSLHYKQEDGYAYAIDLRVKNRMELRNKALKAYFYLLGFKTLRHGGTGDHLHVSMPCRYRPAAR